MSRPNYDHECLLDDVIWPHPARGSFFDALGCLFTGHAVSFVWGHSRCDGLPRCMQCGTPMPEEARA